MKKTSRIVSLLLTVTLCLGMFSTISMAATEVTFNDNTYTINEKFSDSEIPEGFSEATISYQGEDTRGIANSDDSIFKLYLECPDNSKLSGWYQYLGQGQFAESASGGAIALAGGTLTIEEPDSDVVIPDGIEETTVSINGTEYKAYLPKDDEEDGLDEYLVYGTEDGTEHAWYLLDVDSMKAVKTSIDFYGKVYTYEDENTKLTSKLEKLQNKYNKNIKKAKIEFLVLCVLTMLFFFLMLNAMIKRKHMRLDMEDRILDLKLHGGKDTMKIGKKDLKKRMERDQKAMERNDIEPSAIPGGDAPVKSKKKKSKQDEDDYDFEPVKPKKKAKKKAEDDDFFSDISFDDNIDEDLGSNDFSEIDDDDDIEFIDLDL